MKRWQDIIDRLKDEGDWDAAAALWDARQAATLTDSEREAVRYMIAAGKFGQRDEALTEEHAATLYGLLERQGGER